MKSMKKIFALACAGALMMLAFTGCFGIGGGDNGGNGGNGGGTVTPSGNGGSTSDPIVGTWTLDAAYAYDGTEYDLSKMTGTAKIVVTSTTKATMYYFDDPDFPGTLSRDTSRDSHYAVTGYDAKCYDLEGSDGSYWEFALITPTDDPSAAFIYMEVGPEDNYDGLYFARH